MRLFDLFIQKAIVGEGGGGEAVLINKNIDANGTYYASTDHADGYKKVVVDVEPTLGTKSITQNGNYSASSDNLDGYSSVSVDVSADVGTKNITQNGTYTASTDGYEGYSSVVVDVPRQIETLPSVPQTKATDIIIVDGDYYLWRAS